MMPLPSEAFFIVSIFIFLAGLCIGSFLNVCIWRIPRDESIVRPGSHCPACNHAIAPWDNIPLLSWLLLRGRCRHCHAPISPRYVVVELLTGALFAGIWLVHGWTVQTPVYWLFAAALILGTFVDLDHLILPDRVTIGGMIAGPVLALAFPELHDQTERLPALIQSLTGLGLGGGLLWLVAILGRAALKREAMGLGDVKLLGAIGACLGWRAVLFTVFVSSFSGTLFGLGLIAAGRKELQSRIPYGPHLALAAILWMFCGPACIDFYLAWAFPSRPPGFLP
ncbi:MAG: prepilin peptidase [Kiritimatiellae bacterium]|jgi:leader peptidase (prepilin peptidase)/N-methyltransferase|nr:prepilin peptidase [Kiritimatiellia bacterium]NLD88752.1 prepilin peptidase [Lentisphaerota bacterium]HOU21250.1 prepilin peptidase [Kiritimatiellia bacterium]HPC18987.1 prepilin peptidase [Kiritimatiellia bacterium]HQN80724.1 prepilin peptidase [Kiritimatiellia bacterium]